MLLYGGPDIMLKKWDIALIVLLLILSFIPEAVFMLSGENNTGRTYAVIQVNGKEYKTIPLSEHAGTDSFRIMTDNGYNTVVVQDHAIAITEADCPDHICVQSGFITQPGATTVCLPHKVMIEVRSADSQEPDVIPAR